MPLDPQVQVVLKQRAAAGLPPIHTMTPQQAREMMAALRPPVEPEPVGAIEDRTIPGPAGQIPIRIYKPAAPGPFPVLVYFHGGGWVIGDIESHDATCRMLTNASQWLVISVDYRLAPEHKFPAAVEDAYAATCWAAEHAAELGGDPNSIAVGGDSAGANLATVVSLLARDKGNPKLCYQILVYPVTNYAFDTLSYAENDGYILTKDAMKWFWGHYLRSEADGRNPLASPLQAEDLSGLPPALIITAEYDPLRDEGEAYGQRLQEAGVPVMVKRYNGMVHGFFTMAAVLDRGREAIQEVGRVLQSVRS